ncbi:MAG: polysaccharide biosynthesis protein [Thermoanaerobaculales bacterium]
MHTNNKPHLKPDLKPQLKSHLKSHLKPQLDALFHRAEKHLLAARVPILILGHIVVFTFAFRLAFTLRFDFAPPFDMVQLFWTSLPLILAVKLTTFYLLGHFHGWWRYVTFADFTSLSRACLASTLLIVFIDHFLVPWQIPRSVIVLDCLLTGIILAALRASWRLVREDLWPALNGKDVHPVLMVGADEQTGILAHQIHAHPQLKHRILGFLELDPSPRRQLGGIRVLGTLDELTSIASVRGVREILVVAGTLTGHRLRELMDTCHDTDLNLKIIPPSLEHLNGDHRIPIRDVQINDLLHREPVELDMRAIRDQIEGCTILVTGAGGSIGSEICRQVLRFQPASLVLVEHAENNLFLVRAELERLETATKLHACVGDILDEPRMRRLFEAHRPRLVFHAAAHKHVGLMELNAGEAVKNNIFGTKCVADLADEFSVERFVFISTDKAVNPTSVMGASKHIAERYVHAMSQESSTIFLAVRFGNVLGSAGSVVPIFQDQIRRGGPITITDPRMTRFFMTIPEASQLVLQAAAMGKGGEIFVLEMGEQIRIIDLAKDLIRLSGLPPDAIEIQYTGIRPGEKLYEELYFDNEQTLDTSHPKLRSAYHRHYTMAEVCEAICTMKPTVDEPDQAICDMLHTIVPEYNGHNCKKKGLVGAKDEAQSAPRNKTKLPVGAKSNGQH